MPAPMLELATHRDVLFRLCYRMTGSAADADDLVQETFRRALEHSTLDSSRELRPWLIRVAINLSRDALRARKRRAYLGPWLPSPLETAGWEHGPASGEARYDELESVTMAFLLALEALSPTQRAVLLLRDVLDYSGAETAEALGLSEANVKTTLHRARKSMEAYDAQAQAPTPERRAATERMLQALCGHLLTHNVRGLEALLAEDVRALNDGGGEFFAAQRPILGRTRVIKFHLKVQRRAFGRLEIREINGLPALVMDIPTKKPGLAERAVLSIALDARGKIAHLDTVVASSKLSHVNFDSLRTPKLTELLQVLRSTLLLPRFAGLAFTQACGRPRR